MYVNYILCVNIQNSTGSFVVNTRYHAMRVNTANNLAPYGCHSTVCGDQSQCIKDTLVRINLFGNDTIIYSMA